MKRKQELNLVQESLRLLLKPVMRYCLRHSLRLQEILDACKAVLIEIAEEEIRATGERSTVNRMSIMTGIHRADVARLQTSGPDSLQKSGMSVANRLIAQWQSDKRFRTKNGRPKVLRFDGKEGEFSKLVQSVSADPNPYSLLNELIRVGAVEHIAEGIRLLTPELIVSTDPRKSFEHLSVDMNNLISTVEENIFTNARTRNLHLRTEYDNIPSSFVPQLRKWLLDEGSRFHKRAREYLSRFDRDANQKLRVEDTPARISLCSFSRIEEIKMLEDSDE